MAMQIGLASGSITPDGAVSLWGQFHTRISKFVESDLTANAVVLTRGENQLILCSCDLESVHPSLRQRILELVEAQRPEIDADAMMLFGTHTHTAPKPGFSGEDYPAACGLRCAVQYLPEGYSFRDETAEQGGYLSDDEAAEQLCRGISRVIVQAWDNRAPGSFGGAFGRAVIGHQRRTVYTDGLAQMYGLTETAAFREMEGGSDSGVELLYFFDGKDAPAGVLVNVACPSQVVESEEYVSSDFWGKARDVLQEKYGKDFVLVAMCAPAGDQSPRDLVRSRRGGTGAFRPRREDASRMWTLEGAKELGRRAANAVMEHMEEGFQNRKTDGFLETHLVSLDLPVRKVTPAQYKASRRSYMEALAAMGKTELTPYDVAAVHYQSGDMYRFERQETDRILTIDMVTARLDDMAFASSPFELFLDFGNQIRARSWAAQTFLAQLCNGSAGYLPTEKGETGGGYSGYVSSGIVGHEAGELLVEKTLDEINGMFLEE